MSVSPITPRRILVVDDEPFVCDAVKMMLAFDGHQVQTATSAEEALALFEKDQYDLVITDYAMPTKNGDKLAAEFKSRSPGLPVILITAYAEMLKATGKLFPTVDCVVSKPFLLENLREAIAKTMSKDTHAGASPN